MPIIKVTQADLLKSKLIDPGYYGATIVKVSGLEKSKDGKSANVILTFRIDGVGKEITHYFNSMWLGMMSPLYKAVFQKDMPEGDFDTDEFLNKKVDVKIFTDNYQGSLNNKIEGWVPYGKGKDAMAAPF